jgi:signal transduction histidine kinase/ActR/RegA family two-component response regulator
VQPGLHKLLDPLTVQQDYFWFLALLGWSGVVWHVLQAGAPRPAPRWLLVLAGFQIAGCAAEIIHFMTVPQNPLYPSRAWEWTSWIVCAAVAVCLGAAIGPGRAWCTAALAAAGVAGQMTTTLALGKPWPIYCGTAVVLLVAFNALSLVRQQPRGGMPGLALSLVIASACAPNGPLAELANEARRWAELSVFSVPAACATGIAALFAQAPREGPALRAWWDVERRPRTLQLGSWLAAGFVFAVISGAIARRGFERSLLSRTEAYALAIDTGRVEAWLKNELRIGESLTGKNYAGRPMTLFRAPAIANATIKPVRDYLERMDAKEDDVLYTHISILHKREIVLVLFRRFARDRPDIVVGYGEATTLDLRKWASREAHVLPPATGPRGPLVQAKAPLLASDGAMLGWLGMDTTLAHWVAAQAQARLHVIAAVALGTGFIILAERHRRRSFEKESAEQAAAIARAADQAKSSLLAQVSHELRTPIQSILGYGELLRSADLTAQQRGWLDAQRVHGEALLRLVNDLLDCMALQSGALCLQPRIDCVSGAIREAVEPFRLLAQRKGLTLRLSLAPDMPAQARFDATRIRQVAQNLISNAVKFTPAGQVDAEVSITRQPGSYLARLVVRDTGPGIDANARMRLFRPFERGLAAHVEGVGLGLALSRQLCRAMGGDLVVDDNPGPGATFVATWVMAADESTAAETSAPMPARLDRQRVLVAEDNALVRELFVEALRLHGAEVAVAGNGAEALARAAAEHFDVLLLDHSMPGLAGDEVARQLRAGGSRLRIIGLSAHADPQHQHLALASGMDEFLSKPISVERLVRAINPEASPLPPEMSPALRALRDSLRVEFLAQVQATMDAIRAACRRSDWTEIRRSAHHLKGSADILNYTAVSFCCASLYRAAERQDEQDVRAAFEQLSARMHELVATA